MLGATISKGLGENATIEQRFSTSSFSTLLDLGDGAFAQRNSIRDLRIGGSLLARGTAHDRSIGYELATHRIRYASGSSQTGRSISISAATPVGRRVGRDRGGLVAMARRAAWRGSIDRA